MDPSSIVAIALAGISALTSIGAVVYVGVKSYFKDKQDTEIIITNEVSGHKVDDKHKENGEKPYAKTSIVIKFDNLEVFGSEKTTFKNGQSKASTTDQKTIPILDKKTKSEDFIIQIEEEDNFNKALTNNNLGDIAIEGGRGVAVKESIKAFIHTITMNTRVFTHDDGLKLVGYETDTVIDL